MSHVLFPLPFVNIPIMPFISPVTLSQVHLDVALINIADAKLNSSMFVDDIVLPVA